MGFEIFPSRKPSRNRERIREKLRLRQDHRETLLNRVQGGHISSGLLPRKHRQDNQACSREYQ
jgi:hypothetical protein